MDTADSQRAKLATQVLAMAGGVVLAGWPAAAYAVDSNPPPTSPLVVPGTPSVPAAPAAAHVQVKKVTDAAVADAAKRMGRPAAELKYILSETVTWSDGSLGCPEPSKGYTDALVRGYRVRVGTSAKDWLEYHAGLDGKPFYCPPERVRPPAPDDGT